MRARSADRRPRSSEPQGRAIVTQIAQTHERSGQLLGRRDEEQRVGQSALARVGRGTARRIGHLASVGIDADHELERVEAGAAQDRLAGARSKVDHDARGAVGPIG